MSIWVPILWTITTAVIGTLWVRDLSRRAAVTIDYIALVIGTKLWALLTLTGWFTWAIINLGEN